jgi:hypothetical protein
MTLRNACPQKLYLPKTVVDDDVDLADVVVSLSPVKKTVERNKNGLSLSSYRSSFLHLEMHHNDPRLVPTDFVRTTSFIHDAVILFVTTRKEKWKKI